VSVDGARIDYGVVFKDLATFEVDTAETARLRAALSMAAE
jgi:N-methylhydantoinase B